MDNKEVVMIPFVAHESAMNRLERVNKGLIKVVIGELIIILAMFIGIMVYFYLPSETIETISEENSQTVDNIDSIENSNITNGE